MCDRYEITRVEPHPIQVLTQLVPSREQREAGVVPLGVDQCRAVITTSAGYHEAAVAAAPASDTAVHHPAQLRGRPQRGGHRHRPHLHRARHHHHPVQPSATWRGQFLREVDGLE